MAGRITRVLREYVVVFSILLIVPGVVFLFMGISYYAFQGITKNAPLTFIFELHDWNAYILVGGLIIFGTGLYYIYSYLKKRKFLLKELKTDKRSEILKKRNELKNTAKHLPSKYQRMLTDKEDELGIK